jgi:hypothetical protein
LKSIFRTEEKIVEIDDDGQKKKFEVKMRVELLKVFLHMQEEMK